MAADIDVTLQGGRTTHVLFVDTIRELSSRLSDYGQRVLWVFDVNSARLFTSLPENNVILPSGEKFKSWSSIEKILSIPVSRVIPTTSVLLAIDRLKDLV